MIVNIIGAAVFGIVALVVPLVLLGAGRRHRASTPTSRRGLARIFGRDDADLLDRFGRTLAWSIVVLEIAVLVSWAAAYTTITNYAVVGVELAVVLVVLAVGLMYAARRGVLRPGRSTVPEEPTT